MVFDPVITITLSLVLSYIFVVAAFHKWQNRIEFTETLNNYQVLPEQLAGLMVWVLPVLELITGIALLIPMFSSLAAVSATLLLLTYMLAIGINLLRGRRTIDCGCGAPDQKQAISEWLLLRNAVLIFFAWVLTNPVSARNIFWFDWTVIVLATAIGCLFYNIVNQLLVNKGLLKTLRSQHG